MNFNGRVGTSKWSYSLIKHRRKVLGGCHNAFPASCNKAIYSSFIINFKNYMANFPNE